MTRLTETMDTDRLPTTPPARSMRRRAWYASILFWVLALMLSAGGHRLFVSLRSLDQRVSSETYQHEGMRASWVGHGTVEQSLAQKRQSNEAFVSAAAPESVDELHVLPVSQLWAGLGVALTLATAIVVWGAGRMQNRGLQSLVGALAGHALWIGAIEIGLDVAGRRMGLSGALAVVENRVVGVHGSGVLIQWSALFLVPVLIGLTLHESNRCVVFRWFRKHLPLTRSVAASGRVDNYAGRILIQFFMTVWFCYVGVLWMADSSITRYSTAMLTITLLAIMLGTPYMVYRTTRQKSVAGMFRYSVSGAVVTWSGIEIAAASNMITEPWLNSSVAGLAVFTIGPIVLVVLSVIALRESSGSGRVPDSQASERAAGSSSQNAEAAG
ncbi:hypothetical protein [Allorhodopirellula solitaria]|uniref:hypothetical protein n=1 Tax=Allorhodopirellula solitaria TaxID=2527987 RepID=UPI0011B56A56|nr:hypothetical protein [Allorhodopirellula solitaria]